MGMYEAKRHLSFHSSHLRHWTIMMIMFSTATLCMHWKCYCFILWHVNSKLTWEATVWIMHNIMKQFQKHSRVLSQMATNLDGRSDTAHLRRTPANSDTTQQRTNWFSWYRDSGWSSYESSRSVKCASPTWWSGNCSCKPRVCTTPIMSPGTTAPGRKAGSRSNSQQQQ